MASSRKTLIALNGFLGRPADWQSSLAPAGWEFQAWAPEAPERLIERVGREEADAGVKVLLGYSMGGRLAMQAVTRDPSLFDGAVFVSANPGLSTQEERDQRLKADDGWANRFLIDPWETVVSDWNQQAVLRAPQNRASDAVSLERGERFFSRVELAKALRDFSLGRQPDLRADLRSLKMPLLFVTGREDSKFTSLTQGLVAGTSHEHVVIEQAGHRVPWDAPTQFRAILAKFLSRW